MAVGDINGDDVPDIIAAAGPGGGPHVKVIDGTKLGLVDINGEIEDSALLASFYAYDPGFAGGVFVAFNQISPGTVGSPILITGADAGGGPHVKVIDGTKLGDLRNNAEIADSALVGQFYAYGADAVPPLSAAAAAFARTITDLYVFRSPANANNTVFIFDFQPFPGNTSRTVAEPARSTKSISTRAFRTMASPI